MSHHPLFSLNAAIAHGACMFAGFLLLNAGIKYARDGRKQRAAHLTYLRNKSASASASASATTTHQTNNTTPSTTSTPTSTSSSTSIPSSPHDQSWNPVSAYEQPPWLHDHSLFMALCKSKYKTTRFMKQYNFRKHLGEVALLGMYSSS